MEAQGSQTTTLASQRLNLALREADSEVTTGAWLKQVCGDTAGRSAPGNVGPNSRRPLFSSGIPSKEAYVQFAQEGCLLDQLCTSGLRLPMGAPLSNLHTGAKQASLILSSIDYKLHELMTI